MLVRSELVLEPLQCVIQVQFMLCFDQRLGRGRGRCYTAGHSGVSSPGQYS